MTDFIVPEGLVVPHLSPDQVRVFLAEDSSTKRRDITASLGAFDMAHSVEVVTNFDDAEAFIEDQTAGSLAANVFLLDGNLDASSEALWHGSRLANNLYRKYEAPIVGAVKQATAILEAAGLSTKEVEQVIAKNPVREITAHRLNSEALLVGISGVSKGELGYPAQLPWVPYNQVGRIVYEAVIPAKARKQIERQQARFSQLYELARTAPKIPEDDPRVEAYRHGDFGGHDQFGNNFFRFFMGLEAIVDGTEKYKYLIPLAQASEAEGLDPLSFFQSNQELCRDIFAATKALGPYNALLQAYANLLELEREGKVLPGQTAKLNESAAHPMGIEAIGVYLWDQLNPLLEQASREMERLGANVKEICR